MRSTRTSTRDHPIIRPANYLTTPARAAAGCVVERDGVRLAVVNLSGNVFLRAGRVAFLEIDQILEELRGQADHVLVDIHAEATSEKVAMGWHLDGRVTAVVGTHTHVPTADARVLPGGTAYITDVGMTGPRGGVIGVRKEQAIESLRTHMSIRFETSEDDPWLNAVVITCAPQPLRAAAIEQVLVRSSAKHDQREEPRRCRGRTSGSRRAGARSGSRRTARPGLRCRAGAGRTPAPPRGTRRTPATTCWADAPRPPG